MNKLMGRTEQGTEIDDGLKRLDKLTQEEDRMATAQTWMLTHTMSRIDEGVAYLRCSSCRKMGSSRAREKTGYVGFRRTKGGSR